ncbi:dihydrodipicolinate synthase family protein [Solirubrobacter sp. CPCC 204708]|uniref:Dihydrodipicolinate synthase family protein n=1 Tax=Solirubrobacter deserti TaxID=2282478 RepID=A0ABT4RUS6_9ACTN|nr:dihydrodipicolinate synthase family protein [Solirubrobacter deserti]MBE2319333.1 dihydrodipicolinate synthase family protein [Solirubrobacter deserti]MDA0142305.1 dihydrodipicolinate synthase family protein [Solirubrobacter deserti]
MFTGLSAFPLTPLDEDGIHKAAFTRLVTRLATADVDAIAALGSTGSYAYLTSEERAKVARITVQAAQGKPVIVGIGALRTRDVLQHAHDAQTAGADGLLLAPVSYQRLTDEEVFGLFEDVTRAISIPLAVYDNPTTTGFTFSDELHTAIANLPHVGAIKLPGGERIATLRKLVPAHVRLGVSGDWFAAEALANGADVWFSVLGGLFPEAARAVMDGADLEPLWDLFRRHGSVRVVATAAALRGLTSEPNLPRPLRAAPADEVAPVLEQLKL